MSEQVKRQSKYTTLTELSVAFKSGELDNTYRLIIDKGGCSLHLAQSGPRETEDEQCDKCEKLFEREYGDPIVELLTLAGIPGEWC